MQGEQSVIFMCTYCIVFHSRIHYPTSQHLNLTGKLCTFLYTGFLAAESVYGKCLHTQAIQDLMQEFDVENGLSPASHPDNSHLSLDHSYQVSYLLLI